MTFRQLRKQLQDMDDDRLDDTATIHDRTTDEYFPVETFKKTGEDCDVLDEGHGVIVFSSTIPYSH